MRTRDVGQGDVGDESVLRVEERRAGGDGSVTEQLVLQALAEVCQPLGVYERD